jgi:hypothetical protein
MEIILKNWSSQKKFKVQSAREAGAQCSYMSTSTTFSGAYSPENRQLSFYPPSF